MIDFYPVALDFVDMTGNIFVDSGAVRKTPNGFLVQNMKNGSTAFVDYDDTPQMLSPSIQTVVLEAVQRVQSYAPVVTTITTEQDDEISKWFDTGLVRLLYGHSDLWVCDVVGDSLFFYDTSSGTICTRVDIDAWFSTVRKLLKEQTALPLVQLLSKALEIPPNQEVLATGFVSILTDALGPAAADKLHKFLIDKEG